MKLPAEGSVSQACPLCGARDTGGLNGCIELFGSLAALAFSDPSYFAYQRLTVDAYCLQHPEIYMASTKSAATHLAAMWWSLERGLTHHLHPRSKRLLMAPEDLPEPSHPSPCTGVISSLPTWCLRIH
ncbi:DUF5946 family protein [Pelagibacterium lentulum]|uniref:DUF5946 family protein n=1 Tax=Pelagibacterium lentulum TaxID=2029865 RepID=UPI000F8CD249|nr:DUF5946 family protein [Pelagibacterium lentulum]